MTTPVSIAASFARPGVKIVDVAQRPRPSGRRHRLVGEGSETVLEPGMTFHLPICTWVPADKIGIGFSESIAVTETGCETLTSSGDRVLAIR